MMRSDREDLEEGRRLMAIGAAWFFGASILTGIGMVWFPRGQSYLVGLAGMAWGAVTMYRGYRRARAVAAGAPRQKLARTARTLLIASVGTLVLGYWTWHLLLYKRSRLIARWEIDSGTLNAFDSLETRLFEELQGARSDAEWLATWDRYAPRLAGFRGRLEELLITGERLEGFLRKDGEKRALRGDLRIVDLYLREAAVYRDIQEMFADRRPGSWPEGLDGKIDELEALIGAIRESGGPESTLESEPPLRAVGLPAGAVCPAGGPS